MPSLKKSNKTEQKVDWNQHWNQQILPKEETILTLSPEAAVKDALKKKDVGLLGKYEIEMKKQINHCDNDAELKEILRNRLEFIKRFVALKKLLAHDPIPSERNRELFDRINNCIKDLIKKLDEHKEYIVSHKTILDAKGASESHIHPLIPNIIADAFDYLAILKWNLSDESNEEELASACVQVLQFYRQSINYLREEKELIADKVNVEKKIRRISSDADKTIDELEKIVEPLDPSSKRKRNVENLKKQI